MAVKDMISPAEAGSLYGLFCERLRRSADRCAYRYFDDRRQQWREITWRALAQEVARWQAAFRRLSFSRGDRVAIMSRNRLEWVIFDQAAMGVGLVTVPLYVDDRADNGAYILNHSDSRFLLVEEVSQYLALKGAEEGIDAVSTVVCLGEVSDVSGLLALDDWLAPEAETLLADENEAQALASIVYTSGTTGRPKGVMLSHWNMLTNADACLHCVDVYPDDRLLSFLPLSHTFERTAGYYLSVMAGAEVAFSRSIPQLAEDMQTQRPTILIAVPRIFERIHNRVMEQLEQKSPLARRLFQLAVSVGWQRFEWRQGRGRWHPRQLLWPLLNRLVAAKIRARMGGRLRFAVSGSAPLSTPVAQMIIGLGVPVVQGYGLTESSPVISACTMRDNIPASIGQPVKDVEVKIGANDELLARGPNIMLGYWKDSEATAAAIDAEGWLHSGDKARFDDSGHLYITGRLKDIIVLANGEKVPPADAEMAIALDPLFEQVMVVGEGRPYLAALVVLESTQWQRLLHSHGWLGEESRLLEEDKVIDVLLDRINRQMHHFPGYAQVRRVKAMLTPWTVESGLMTASLKIKRQQVALRFQQQIEALYEGHR